MVICLTKYLLCEKYHLSKIWLAAHWEKKIKRAQIFEVDIVRSVHDIMEAEIILDLRISGHLLVGIVKIHSRKTKYLLSECNSIFYQVKIFHAGRIDLPENKQTAAVNEITLTEFFNDNFHSIGNDILDSILASNQSRVEDITLKETNERLTLLDDDDMEDFIFHEEDEPFDFPDENMTSFYNDIEASKDLAVGQHKLPIYKQLENQNINMTEEKGLYEFNGISDKDEFDSGTLNLENLVNEISESFDLSCMINRDTERFQAEHFDDSSVQIKDKINETFDQLNLEPLATYSNDGVKNKKLRKRKRTLCIDYVKCIPEADLQRQVLDTYDIVSLLDMAPSTKRQMALKETGCAEKLFCSPVVKLNNTKLLKLYQRHLKTRPCDNFELPPENKKPVQNFCKSSTGSSKECAGNGNLSDNFDETSVLEAAKDDNFILNTETADDFLENTSYDILNPENALYDKFLTNDVELNVSKTSEEKWEYMFQGRLINMLQCLKSLFAEKSTIQFSHLTQKNRRLLVAQKFFCLLMLRKFEVISLEQSESYGEIFVLQDLNFESACSKFCIC